MIAAVSQEFFFLVTALVPLPSGGVFSPFFHNLLPLYDHEIHGLSWLSFVAKRVIWMMLVEKENDIISVIISWTFKWRKNDFLLSDFFKTCKSNSEMDLTIADQ